MGYHGGGEGVQGARAFAVARIARGYLRFPGQHFALLNPRSRHRHVWPSVAGDEAARCMSCIAPHERGQSGIMPLMVATGRSDEVSAIQGDFGEAWLEVVAAAQGLGHNRGDTLDFDKADVILTLREEVGNTYHPSVKVQVKTTIHAREDEGGNLIYDLDAQTHNILCKTNHSTRRTLVVVEVSADGERVRLAEDGTLLVGRAAWVSLEGRDTTDNTRTKAVTLPAANTVDEPGLRRMLETYGVRRTTDLPDFNPWKEAP
jgi:hypothetical protein